MEERKGEKRERGGGGGGVRREKLGLEREEPLGGFKERGAASVVVVLRPTGSVR